MRPVESMEDIAFSYRWYPQHAYFGRSLYTSIRSIVTGRLFTKSAYCENHNAPVQPHWVRASIIVSAVQWRRRTRSRIVGPYITRLQYCSTAPSYNEINLFSRILSLVFRFIRMPNPSPQSTIILVSALWVIVLGTHGYLVQSERSTTTDCGKDSVQNQLKGLLTQGGNNNKR